MTVPSIDLIQLDSLTSEGLLPKQIYKWKLLHSYKNTCKSFSNKEVDLIFSINCDSRSTCTEKIDFVCSVINDHSYNITPH